MSAAAPPGGVGRREFLGLSAGSVAAALLAACTTGHGRSASSVVGPISTTTTTAPDNAVDIKILRTASSIEHYLVGLYMEAAGLNLVKTPMVLEMAKYFADQHSDHAAAFEAATTKAGGQPFTEANPVLSRMANRLVAGLATETDVVRLAYEAEDIVTATYVAATGLFLDHAVNAIVMGVGAVEARHLAVLGTILSGAVPAAGAVTPAYRADGFASISAALVPGTGV